MSGCARLQSMHVGANRLRVLLVTVEGLHTIDLPATPPQVAALRHLHGPRSDCPALGPTALGLLRQLGDHGGVAVCRVVLQPGPAPQSWLRVGDRDHWTDLPLDVVGLALLLTAGELPVSVQPPAPVDWDAALQRLMGDR